MKEYNIYPPKLQEYLISTRYIPRKIHNNEHLKLFHKYWINDRNIAVKVEDLYIIDEIEYYDIKYNKTMYGCITFPVDTELVYELLHNKESIEKHHIINSNISYSGAEIKYWFIYNKINFNNDNYSGFWSFLNPLSNNLLVDNKYYFVSYKSNRKQKCQMILDKSKL